MKQGPGPDDIDRETAGADKLQLRLWLRLLTCTQMMERRVRASLRAVFDTTLLRFDLLSQLDAAAGALSMSDLSSRLMVTSGNLTSLIDAMEQDGLISRVPHPVDRRRVLVAMTAGGRAAVAEMAPRHKGWIATMMGSMTRAEMRALFDILKTSVGNSEASLMGERGAR